MADGDVLVLTGGHQSFSAASAVASGLPRIRAIVASDATFTSGSVAISGYGAATVNTTTQQVRISVPVQTTQPTLAVVGSDATFSSGSVSISGFGAATVNTTTGLIRISVPAVVAQTNQTAGLYAASQTTGGASSTTLDARTLSFAGHGAVSVGFSAGSVQISVPSVVAQSSVTFGNANGVSFGLAGSTVTASVAAQSAETVGLYALSNTTGGATSTTLDARTLSINAYGAASAGFSNGSIQISVPTVVAQSSVTFSNSNGVSFGLNGSTVTASVAAAGGATLSSWFHNSAAMLSTAMNAMSASAHWVNSLAIPVAISFTRVDMLVSLSVATAAVANTGGIAISSVGVLYSQNGSTLNPIVGALGTVTLSWASNSGLYSSITGARLASFPLATTLSAGIYFWGYNLSSTSGISTGTATTALNATVSHIFGNMAPQSVWADFNASTGSSVNPVFNMQGQISSAISATSQTIQQSQISATGNRVANANVILLFRNNA